MASASPHAPIPSSSSAVSRPRTLLISLPDVLKKVVQRKEVVKCLCIRVKEHAVKCVQDMGKGCYRATFNLDSAYNYVFVNGLPIRDMQCGVAPADAPLTYVKLHRCPVETSKEVIKLTLSAYGKVVEISDDYHPEFKTILNGSRTIRMIVNSSIPSSIMIKRHPCHIWYRGQPKTCWVCKGKDHEAPTCPLKGKCLRCRQEGHIAKNCTNAWGSHTNAAPVEVVSDGPPETAMEGPTAPAADDTSGAVDKIGDPPGASNDDPEPDVVEGSAPILPPGSSDAIPVASDADPDAADGLPTVASDATPAPSDVPPSVAPDADHVSFDVEGSGPILQDSAESVAGSASNVDPPSNSEMPPPQSRPSRSKEKSSHSSAPSPMVDSDGFIIVRPKREAREDLKRAQRSGRVAHNSPNAQSRSRSRSRSGARVPSPSPVWGGPRSQPSH